MKLTKKEHLLGLKVLIGLMMIYEVFVLFTLYYKFQALRQIDIIVLVIGALCGCISLFAFYKEYKKIRNNQN